MEDIEKPAPGGEEDKDDKEDQDDKYDKDEQDDKENKDDNDEEERPDWWQSFLDKVNQVKEWATSLFEGEKEGIETG